MKVNWSGVKIAILVADGFERDEMSLPRQALKEAGASTTLISPNDKTVKSWKGKDWSEEFAVDQPLKNSKPEDYDALLLPGGVINPDTLRINSDAVEFIAYFVNKNKPIAAICHGPWPLINAEGVKNKTLTSWPSLKADLMNAGANWIDQEVVTDDQLVTSRKPSDIPAFNVAILELLKKNSEK